MFPFPTSITDMIQGLSSQKGQRKGTAWKLLGNDNLRNRRPIEDPSGTEIYILIIVKFSSLCFLILIPGWLSDIHSYSSILHSHQERDFASIPG